MQRSILSAAALVLMLPACSQDDPADPFGVQMSQIEAQAATVTWGEYVMQSDNTGYAACVDEDIHFWGSSSNKYHDVLDASGASHHFEYIVESIEFNAVGLDSGTEWWLIRPITAHAAFGSGPGPIVQVTESDWFQNADGERMLVQNLIHISVNADGEPTAYKFQVVDCKFFPAH